MKTIIILISALLAANITTLTQQWNEVNTQINQDVIDVKFINANIGWVLLKGATGSVPVKILKTTNKGTSWTQVFSGDNTGSGGAIEILDENTGFLYYNNKILKTTNGFQSTSVVASFPISTYYRIKFVNSQTGYALLSKEYSGSNHGISVFKTVNGGNSWYVTALDNDLSGPIYTYARLDDITFSPNNINEIFVCGYSVRTIGGENYLAIRTTDGFETNQNYTGVGVGENPPRASFLANIPNTQSDIRLLAGFKILSYSAGSFNVLAPVLSNNFKGISFSDNTRGFYSAASYILFSSDAGNNWTTETSSASTSISRMNSFGEAAMIGGTNGKFYRRRFPINLKANFDWQSTSSVVPFTLDNLDGIGPQYFYTPQYDVPLLGGTSKCTTNAYIVNGNDTTARFYYWGGIGNGNMNPNGGDSYFIYKGDFNADFKTKFASTTPEALKNANQVKVLKDTNGVTNVVYESMGGIFFTRSKPDGNFKVDEILSGTYGSSQYGNVTYNNSNPYITEFKPYQFTAANPPEKNIWACWERREGNDIKILVAARSVDPLNRPEWYVQEYATIQNAPVDFKCFPKIIVAGNLIYNTRVLTYLKPVSGSSRKLVGKIFYNSNPNIQERDIIPAANIQEYAIAPIANNGLDGSTVFNVHVAYRTIEPNSQQPVHYKHVKIGWDQLVLLPFFYEVPGTFTQISNDISRWRASVDIALKNASDNTNSYSMQPVVTYQGRYDVRIIIPNEDGPPQEVPGSYYPVYVRERLTSGGWSSSSILYNSLNNIQQTPNIEGSKQRNSCLLNYTRIEGGANKNLQVVPRWNNSVPNAYYCVPNYFTGTDAKIQKGALVNASSTSQKLMTLSQSGSVYNIGAQNFNITNEQITNDGGSFEAISGTVTDDQVKYSFNLGNIMVNWNLIGFSIDIDTTIEDTPDFNDNLKSKPFLLNDNDTLVIGRNAFYILESGDVEPLEIEYKVKLMNKSTETMHRLLAQDTIHAGDTIQVEFLEGYIITNITSCTDSFYVQMEIDTIDGSYGIGGGNGDGVNVGDSPVNSSIKRKIFWENERPNMKTRTIPTKFNIYQNFPNPFNPVTKIKYDLPRNSNVTIIIYDLLGREVTRLVNNELRNAGSYEIEWNANKFASGAYIYRIEAGDFVDTKKMILIK